MQLTITLTKSGYQLPQGSCDFYASGCTSGSPVNNNLLLPDDDCVISRLQVIVHAATDGEDQTINHGNITRVMLNNIPLECWEQVELQDGDILSIDNYHIEVSDFIQDTQPASCTAASGQLPVIARSVTPLPEAALIGADTEPTVVPSEIWDSLMQEFSISDNIFSTQTKLQPEDLPNPFTEPKPAERNPEDPLVMFSDCELLFERSTVVTYDLFANNTPFNSGSIFSDDTPTTLVLAAKTSVPIESQEKLDVLTLFDCDNSVKIAHNDEPLGVMGEVLQTPIDVFSIDELTKAPQSETYNEQDVIFDSLLFMNQPLQKDPTVVHIQPEKGFFCPQRIHAKREEVPESSLAMLLTVVRQALQPGMTSRICTIIASMLQSLNFRQVCCKLRYGNKYPLSKTGKRERRREAISHEK
ncbi:hypothetical protein [Serratia sp. N21D137]|uniref:hypothetical protein n=1 Tax=Serratia sp. N21D137 TaxID=3397495 RepID=UPI0039DFE3D0